MIVLLQRVRRAAVAVREDAGEAKGAGAAERPVSEIGRGLLALVCAEPGDTPERVRKAAAKTARLRVFEDASGRMNRSVLDAGGAVLAVSQFTLAADVSGGNRPSFSGAAEPGLARERFAQYVSELRALGLKVGEGVFGAHLIVSLENDGPATFPMRF